MVAPPAGRLADQEAVAARPVLTALTRCVRSSAPHGGLPVQGSDLVLNGSARFRVTPNPGPDPGPVQEGSGSEPKFGTELRQH